MLKRVIILTNKTYRLVSSILVLWLLLWIYLSWAGIQDDALIHLRYADNLFLTHSVTYDGVHPNYGASSLLYIFLLAVLRAFTASPNLPRVVSSIAHVLLICGITLLFVRAIPRTSFLARLLGIIVLCLLVAPSSVRWLDDGMETGLALCFVTAICWVTFSQSNGIAITPVHNAARYAACVALGFSSVLLRTELILLCGLASLLLVCSIFESEPEGRSPQQPRRSLQSVLGASHLLVGGLLALLFIRIKMHVLLPDTALAKSDGVPEWSATLFVTAKILIGAFSFGAGMFLLWLLTFFLLLRARRLSLTVLLPNAAFPALFALAAFRGQLIQGARYFVWTLLFSILWNILDLGRVQPQRLAKSSAAWAAYAFLALVIVAMPLESKTLYPMLQDRASLLKSFESSHLEYFEGKRGISFDIGLIGYFSRADICDLGGLVNGREKARLTVFQRREACVASHPDFFFVDPDLIQDLSHYMSFRDWQICGRYDYKNVTSNDPHYLIVPRATAPEVCRQVGNATPSEVDTATR
jgi:hypothetical protein